jgi:hypothetical protein
MSVRVGLIPIVFPSIKRLLDHFESGGRLERASRIPYPASLLRQNGQVVQDLFANAASTLVNRIRAYASAG